VRAVRRIALMGLAISGLAACGGDSDPGRPVTLAELPHPKPGLWRWSSGAGGVRQLCLSGQVLGVLAPRPGCPVVRQVVLRDATYVVEAKCAGGTVRHISARAWGDFDRAFSTDVQLTDVADHAEYRYLGPCPAGQKPDDAP